MSRRSFTSRTPEPFASVSAIRQQQPRRTRQFAEQFGERMRGVVVQAQHVGRLELLVGAIRDPAFGPFVVVGAGGVETELRDDRVMLVAPVSKSAARDAVESLRLAPLFHGFRGRPALPVDPVVDLVHRVGVLVASIPEIQQLDMNPVLVDASGCVAVDALIGVAVPPSPVVPVRAMRATDGSARARRDHAEAIRGSPDRTPAGQGYERATRRRPPR